MRCIFCKQTSDNSISREHIVPESFGNKDYILGPGWVCDVCNNYLSRKVEAPFLDSFYGRQSRFEMKIPSKRGRIPTGKGLHPQSATKINLLFDGEGLSFFAADGEDESHFIQTLRMQDRGSFLVPTVSVPENNYATARFVGKVAFEIFTHRGMTLNGWNSEIVNKTEFDELRDYIRRGRPGFVWPVSIRRIYDSSQVFSDKKDSCFQVLNEWDILFIPTSDSMISGELYVVIAMLGVEYAMNLGGPELDGYMKWLKENKGRSYLYSGKNA